MYRFKHLVILLFPLILLAACQDRAATKTSETDTSAVAITADSFGIAKPISWIDDFKAFRDAAYTGNKEKLKTYFNFPIQNDPNEIWYLTAAGEAPDASSPFTEKDWDTHHAKIFPPAFVKSLLKIKSAELYEKGEAESPDLKEDSTVYKMMAAFDKKENLLSLNLAFTTVPEEGEDAIESNIIYTFSILPDGRLKFKKINIAG